MAGNNSITALLGSLVDASNNDGSKSYMTRVHQGIDPETTALAQHYAQNAQAKQLENQGAVAARDALSEAGRNGITNPLQLFGKVAAVNPGYLKDYATAASANPLGFALQQPQPGGDGQPTPLSSLQGDDLLKALPPQIASQIKGYSEGRIPFNPRLAATTQGQTLLGLITQYDPSFDTTDVTKRAQTAKSFAPGGKDRANINAIETALNTLALLHDTNEKLGGPSEQGILNKPLNVIRNIGLGAEGDDNLYRYDKLSKDAADEVTKAIIANGGTGADREERHKGLSSSNPVNARRTVIKASVDELMQRLNPVADSYNTGMGKNSSGVQLMTPQAQAAYKKVMGEDPQLTKVTGDANQNVTTNASSASPAPKVLYNAKGQKATLTNGKWVIE